MMGKFFFSGAHDGKLDEKNRFVLPQSLRYGLIENGSLEFTLGLGLGGCLTIYRKSEIDALVARLKSKIHTPRYRRFFTLFFSTLHHTTCDKLGRVLVPAILKRAAKIDSEVIIAGVLDKIEIWSKAQYELDLESFLLGGEGMYQLTEEVLTSIIPQPLVEKENELDESDEGEFTHLGDDPRDH